MENIVLELVQSFATSVGSISGTLQSFINNSPILQPVFKVFLPCLIAYFQFLYLCLMLRFFLYWFPNINPFTVPYIYLFIVTSPYERFFEKYTPLLFGMNFAFLLLNVFLERLITILSQFQSAAF